MAKNIKSQNKDNSNKNHVNKKSKLLLSIGSSVIVILIVITIFKINTFGQNKDQNSVLANQDIVINTSEISSIAKFYPIDIEGTRLEVVAVKAPDGSIRTAFNTCQICFSSGRGYYKQNGDALVCQNCGNRFSMSRVEIESGGCNPWPIFPKDKIITDKSITIPYEFLKKSKNIFSNWKS
ncbi:MAG: DUF2318 domain-containing protein [Fusobacteriaceae bacterium]|jgi:uncharacterized membrane protein|nr:DUF2318 domain-containing protein [Fusobacteriaceae bacterium]